jgi:hypothetical protein
MKMAGAPWIYTNPKLRQVRLLSGRTIVAERLAEQHYLIWDKGTALTEVRCIPSGSGRWYARGGGMNWSKSRAEAIQRGIVRAVKGMKFNGQPLEAWSPEAQVAMTPAVQPVQHTAYCGLNSKGTSCRK